MDPERRRWADDTPITLPGTEVSKECLDAWETLRKESVTPLSWPSPTSTNHLSSTLMAAEPFYTSHFFLTPLLFNTHHHRQKVLYIVIFYHSLPRFITLSFSIYHSLPFELNPLFVNSQSFTCAPYFT
jgi:hypothetical protein